MTNINPETEQLLATLAQIGGKGMKEEDVIYEGTKLQLPERWRGDLGSAITYLLQKQKEEDEVSVFQRTFNYRPFDGAYNAFQAMKKAFGMVTGKTLHSFFGDEPPSYIQIPVSSYETEEIPWGAFTLPMLSNTTIYFGMQEDPEYGEVFHISIESPRKNRFVIEGLFIAIGEEIKKNSIYRGKAIDGQTTPQFMDLSAVDPTQVVYSIEVETDLTTHIWAPMRYPQAHRKLNLPLKRAILLQGPYGTGKSMAAGVTALIAVENGWTFIMARPGRDDFFNVMQTARLYQPAVVFMEDAETVASGNTKDQVTKVLDIFDGIQAKGNDLMVVLTTNHPELIHEGMRRAGRLDAVINIGALDASGIERLIRRRVANLADEIDFAQVVEACEGYMPSFVKEAADRAIRYTLAREAGNTEGILITTEDLVFAAKGLKAQFEWMNEGKKVDSVTQDDLQEALVIRGVRRTIAELASTEPNSTVWNKNRMIKAQKEKN